MIRLDVDDIPGFTGDRAVDSWSKEVITSCGPRAHSSNVHPVPLLGRRECAGYVGRQHGHREAGICESRRYFSDVLLDAAHRRGVPRRRHDDTQWIGDRRALRTHMHELCGEMVAGRCPDMAWRSYPPARRCDGTYGVSRVWRRWTRAYSAAHRLRCCRPERLLALPHAQSADSFFRKRHTVQLRGGNEAPSAVS